MSDNNTNNSEKFEIDIRDIFARLKARRKLVLTVAAVFFAIGLFLALFSQREYTVSITFVPQTSGYSQNRYSSIASIAGINLDMGSSDAILSPRMYPHLLGNAELLTDLMNTKIHFAGHDEPVDLYTYYTDPEYKKFNLVKAVKKYTLGLPRTVINALRHSSKGSPAPVDSTGLETAQSSVHKFTTEQALVLSAIRNCIEMDVNAKDGYLKLKVNFVEPLATAELAEATFNLLNKYITDFRLKNAESELQFIEQRCKEAKSDYESKQSRYARYVDANRGIQTSTANVEKDRLFADMELSRQLYSEIAKKRMSSQIKVKEQAFAIANLTPVSVPSIPSKPHRVKILFVWTLLGIIAGCGYVLCADWWRNLTKKQD